MYEPEYRLARQDCVCRACSKDMVKGKDSGVFWYSIRNSGMNIIICEDCVKRLNKMVEEGYEE